MSVPTVNVTIQVNDSLGNPVEGARVLAKLTISEKYQGFVVPKLAETISDVSGISVLALFPNELGSEGSEYQFKILLPTGKSLKVTAVVPNVDCNLFEIADLEPYKRVTAGESFSVEVIAARDSAVTSEVNALASETNASQFAADAQQSESDALSSSVSASMSAGQADTSRVAAESARDTAVTAKDEAVSAKDVVVIAKGSVDASVASIPGLIDTKKDEALAELEISKVQLQTDFDLNKSQQARSIGGDAYQYILGFPCPPSLEVKAYDSKDNIDGVPTGFTFTRASSATQVNAIGEIETVANDVLRHEYDASSGEYKGFLIEEQRTNLVLQSGDFGSVSWTKFDSLSVTISPTVVAPDGSNMFILQSASDALSILFQNSAVLNDNQEYTASCYISRGTSSTAAIRVSLSGGSVAAFSQIDINMDTFTIISGVGEIENVGNGIYKISVKVENNATGNTSARLWMFPDALSTNKNSLFGGAQLEQGAFPTSYIPTTTAAATRAADNLSIATADFPYNQSEGTAYCEFIQSRSTDNSRLLSINDGTFTNVITIEPLSGRAYCYVFDGGASVSMDAGEVIPGQKYRVVFTWADGDIAVSLNGRTVIASSSGTIPSGLTSMRVGSAQGGFNPSNTTINTVAYYPRRLSNEQLQALTR